MRDRDMAMGYYRRIGAGCLENLGATFACDARNIEDRAGRVCDLLESKPNLLDHAVEADRSSNEERAYEQNVPKS